MEMTFGYKGGTHFLLENDLCKRSWLDWLSYSTRNHVIVVWAINSHDPNWPQTKNDPLWSGAIAHNLAMANAT